MANRDHCFCDAARYYAQANITEKFTTAPKDSGTQLVGLYGREGRYGHRLASNSGIGGYSNYFSFTLGSSDNYAITEFAWQPNSAITTPILFAALRNVNTYLIGLQWNLDATISVVLLNGGGWSSADTILGTIPNPISVGNYHHIAWITKVHGSAGTVTIHIDGATIPALALTGLNTGQGGSAWTNCLWGYQSRLNLQAISAFDMNYSDIILRDSLSGILKDDGVTPFGIEPLGDAPVYGLRALTGNGAHTDFTPLTGTNQGDMLKEALEDGDTSYTAATLAALRVSVPMEDLPDDVGRVYAVQSVSVARKSLSGTAEINPGMRLGGVDYDGTAVGLGTVYQHCRNVFVTAGAALITPAAVNAGEGMATTA